MSVEISITDQIVEINEVSNPVEISVTAGAAIAPVWGGITGTLSNQTDLQNALNAKVPYTGATANVDLGEFELKAGQLELDQTPTGTAGVAVTRWNNSVGTLETTLKGGSVVLKHGRDMFERVVNKTGIQLTRAAYQAVRVSDAQGQRLAVQLAQANNDNNSADTIGLVVETIDNNQEGFIYTVGEIDNINTTGSLQGETWVDGDVLYLSPTTAGRITNIKPVAPQHLVVIGYVVYAHQNNGKIYVKVMNGWELGELHDVNTTGATNGQVLKYNGTIWVPSSDTGITTLNTLTALSQTFATGTSGTDFNISSATSTHTFNLPSASATNRGLLTSADWTTFNNKQAALNGTGFVKISGTTISYDNSTYYLASNPSAYISLSGLSASAPLSYNNLTGAFSISQASGSTNGFLSSTDWTTFNNKQNALTNPVTGTGVSGQVAYWSGTNTQTGSNNLFWDNANTSLGINTTNPNSGGIFYALGNTNGATRIRVENVNVGNSAVADLYVRANNGGGVFQATSSINTIDPNQLRVRADASLTGGISIITAGSNPISLSTNNVIGLRLFATNNLILQNGGTFTDSGQRLQVIGDTLLRGSGNTSATTALAIQNSTGNLWAFRNDGMISNTAQSQTLLIYPQNVSGTLGTITTGGDLGLVISNSRATTGSIPNGVLFITKSSSETGTLGTNKFLIVGHQPTLSFAPTSGNATLIMAEIQATINQTGGANGITRGLYVNPTLTAAADWRSIETSNNTGWAFYGAGTANSFFGNNIGVGILPSNWNNTYRVTQVGASASFFGRSSGLEQAGIYSNAFLSAATGDHRYIMNGFATYYMQSSGVHSWYIAPSGILGNAVSFTQAMTLHSTGNLAIGTGAGADAGFRLDVNGTMRVSGASTFGGNMALTLNQNAATTFIITNTGSGTNTATQSQIKLTTDVGSLWLSKRHSLSAPFKTISASDSYIYNDVGGNITILNDFASGNINMAAGGSSTAQWTIGSNGDLTAADGENIIVGTTNGTKLGTATSQKIGFWNATPIVQPTTAVAEATFVENSGGTAVNVDSTFDGYTMQQIVKALRNAGLLA